MNKKKVIGTIFIIIAFAIAIYTIVPKGENEKEETTNEETTVEESTSKIAITTTEEVTHETITVNPYRDEHIGEHEIDVRLPDDNTMSYVDNDSQGLKDEIMTFVNGYGYGDASYAAFTGDIELKTNENKVMLTYYLKWKNREVKYFYLYYNKNTKQWSSKQA